MNLKDKTVGNSGKLEYFPLCLPHQNPKEYNKELENYKYLKIGFTHKLKNFIGHYLGVQF